MAYYVSYSEITHNEPAPGWYFERNGETFGPYLTKAEALDVETNCAYKEWLEGKRDERYEEYMRDAGRGHLVRPKE